MIKISKITIFSIAFLFICCISKIKAADVDSFDVRGLKLGMTLEEAKIIIPSITV